MEKPKNRAEKSIREYFGARPKTEFIPGSTDIPLAVPQYGADEVVEALDSLMSGWVTIGRKVKRFERMFAKYMGMKEGVMTNSGSSALLLTFSALSSPRYGKGIQKGDEVVCPAVSWPTAVYPIALFGATPVFADVDYDTMNVTLEEIERAVTRRTKAISVTHLMGNPCEVDRIRSFAEGKGILLVEDACEATGARIGDRMVGSYGLCSAFSFFLSHQITTIEGGMVLSSDASLLDVLRSQRSHGWTREMLGAQTISKKYSGIDDKFLFYELGFNLRPTEIQGAFGVHQLRKLNRFIDVRRRIALEWNKGLKGFEDYLILPRERVGTTRSYFAYPLVLKEGAPFTRNEMVTFLESRKIATRPVAGGSLAIQPSAELYRFRKAGSLSNARKAMRNSFFIGLHNGIGKEQQAYVLETMEEFVSGRTRR